ncbi:MAG: tyrosine-type recombinase/integrase [Caldilineaceae bacterium]|nr:tyrosine-type recombinase/integrase [Caldilineaceae bacterium]
MLPVPIRARSALRPVRADGASVPRSQMETALRRGLVNIALCWEMSDADLRRSEAAALVWDDIARWDNGSGLSVASISRRVKAAARTAGLGAGFSGHSGRVGMARRMARAGAPTHEIMAQGRWRSAGMVADYTRNENAERAAKWLG